MKISQKSMKVRSNTYLMPTLSNFGLLTPSMRTTGTFFVPDPLIFSKVSFFRWGLHMQCVFIGFYWSLNVSPIFSPQLMINIFWSFTKRNCGLWFWYFYDILCLARRRRKFWRRFFFFSKCPKNLKVTFYPGDYQILPYSSSLNFRPEHRLGLLEFEIQTP